MKTRASFKQIQAVGLACFACVALTVRAGTSAGSGAGSLGASVPASQGLTMNNGTLNAGTGSMQAPVLGGGQTTPGAVTPAAPLLPSNSPGLVPAKQDLETQKKLKAKFGSPIIDELKENGATSVPPVAPKGPVAPVPFQDLWVTSALPTVTVDVPVILEVRSAGATNALAGAGQGSSGLSGSSPQNKLDEGSGTGKVSLADLSYASLKKQHRTSCLSNLKQMGLALPVFTDEPGGTPSSVFDKRNPAGSYFQNDPSGTTSIFDRWGNLFRTTLNNDHGGDAPPSISDQVLIGTLTSYLVAAETNPGSGVLPQGPMALGLPAGQPIDRSENAATLSMTVKGSDGKALPYAEVIILDEFGKIKAAGLADEKGGISWTPITAGKFIVLAHQAATDAETAKAANSGTEAPVAGAVAPSK